ncbi:hypothetical protein MWU59_07310 [Flavobacteriaceae bacterium F08102]|nr:hypothetical protein [Flavobacteriaceae bacterium F08102]
MKYLIIAIVLTLVLNLERENDLYIPLEFQKAYQNGSRSYDGKPEHAYWQNSSTYDIEVNIIPGTWKIKGKQIPNSKDVVSISLVADNFPDVDTSNNLLTVKR